MDNRPQGRQKTYGGQANGVNRRGEGLNTGPVGRPGGYQNRPGTTGAQRPASNQQRSTQSRGLGGKGLIVIIGLVIVLALGGGGGLLGLFGGGDSSGTQSGISSAISGLSGLGDLSGLLGGSFLDSSVSTGWTGSDNTGRLDTSVASSARAKYTALRGSGSDTVTIMVYMCGTDLESKSGMASADLAEMTKASLSENINLLVYTGGCTKWQNSSISNQVNQIYKVESGGLRQLVADDGSAAMTKPETLTRFIQYCAKQYPANRNMLIFWDHGGGSLSGYGYDEKNAGAGSMSLSGIDKALKAAEIKFDMIGFDACLMATLENGLMLSSYGDYMVASEETEPGVGWYYTDWLTKLSDNPSMPTIEIGKNIADDFVRVCSSKCPGQKTTLSVVDLAELSATVPGKLTAFAKDTSALIQGETYKQVSDARSGAREFAVSSKIDQVDLVSFAYRLGSDEGKDLAKALLGAVKYNKTSSNMSDSYGLSVYFPYRKASKVSSAVSTYSSIGMDGDYTRCIQQFASVEQTGQSSSNATSSPMTSLLGGSFGSLASGSDISSLLGSLLGDRGADVDACAQFITDNRIDASSLQWVRSGGNTVLNLSEKDWSLIQRLELNVFVDDGAGFIDLGTDNVYDCTDNGELLGSYDGTWLAINHQPIAYYYEDALIDGDSYSITGRVPVLLNGARAELLIVFDNAHPSGTITGARSVYGNGETETVAKSVTALVPGDQIDFLCDYYRYDGSYENSYLLGERWTYTGDYTITNDTLRETTSATYLLTDIYGNEYWTPEIP